VPEEGGEGEVELNEQGADVLQIGDGRVANRVPMQSLGRVILDLYESTDFVYCARVNLITSQPSPWALSPRGSAIA